MMAAALIYSRYCDRYRAAVGLTANNIPIPAPLEHHGTTAADLHLLTAEQLPDGRAGIPVKKERKGLRIKKRGFCERSCGDMTAQALNYSRYCDRYRAAVGLTANNIPIPAPLEHHDSAAADLHLFAAEQLPDDEAGIPIKKTRKNPLIAGLLRKE